MLLYWQSQYPWRIWWKYVGAKPQQNESRGKPWDLLYMPVSCLCLWSCGTRQSRHASTCLSHPLKKEYGTYANPLDYTYMQMLQRSHWFLCGSSPETPAKYTVADCYFSIIWQHSNFICYIACFCFLSLLIITLKGLYAIGTREIWIQNWVAVM